MAFNDPGLFQGFSLFPGRPTTQQTYPMAGYYPALEQLLRKQVQPLPQPVQEQQILDVSPVQRSGPVAPVEAAPVEATPVAAPVAPVEATPVAAPVAAPVAPVEAAPFEAAATPVAAPVAPVAPVEAAPVEAAPVEAAPMQSLGQLMHDYRDLDGRAKRLKAFRANPVKWNLFSDDEKKQALAVIDRAETFGVAADDWAKKDTIINDMDKALAQLENGYAQIKSGYSGETSISDVGIATAYLKAVDPISVARDSEVQSVFNAGSPVAGLVERVKNFIHGGGRMPQEMRDEIMQRIEERKNDSIEAGKAYVDKQKDRLVDTYGDHGRYIIERGVTGLNYEPTYFSDGVKRKRIRKLDAEGTLTPDQRKDLVAELSEAHQTKYNTDRYRELAQNQSPTPDQKAEREALWNSLPRRGLEKLFADSYNPGALDTVGDMAEIAADSLTLGQYPYLKGRLESIFSSPPSKILSNKDPYAASQYFEDLHNAQIAKTKGDYPWSTKGATVAGALPWLLLTRGRGQLRGNNAKNMSYIRGMNPKARQSVMEDVRSMDKYIGMDNSNLAHFTQLHVPRTGTPKAPPYLSPTARRAWGKKPQVSNPPAASNPPANNQGLLNWLKRQTKGLGVDGLREGLWNSMGL